MASQNSLEEMESEEAGGFRGFLRRYRTQLVAAATLILFCMVGYAIMQLTDEVRYDDVVEALADTRVSSILLALLFTGLSFFALIFYDLNAIDYIGKKLPFPHVALTAFSAYAVGNTAGFGALSGGAIRYRAYSRLGLTPEDIGRVIAFVTLSFGLGLASVAAIALMIIADEIGPLINTNALLLRIIAGAILAGLGFVVYLGRDGRAVNLGPIAVRLPDSRTWSRQFLVTAFDIAASATVLYVLLPQTAISWPVFLAVYAIAVGLGVLDGAPDQGGDFSDGAQMGEDGGFVAGELLAQAHETLAVLLEGLDGGGALHGARELVKVAALAGIGRLEVEAGAGADAGRLLFHGLLDAADDGGYVAGAGCGAGRLHGGADRQVGGKFGIVVHDAPDAGCRPWALAFSSSDLATRRCNSWMREPDRLACRSTSLFSGPPETGPTGTVRLPSL